VATINSSVIEEVLGSGEGGGARARAVGLGTELTCEDVERLATNPRIALGLSADGRQAVVRSAETLRAAEGRGDQIYGLTTGFGPLVAFAADPEAGLQGAGLIAHLAAGCGALAPAAVVRGSMLARVHALGQGRSGISAGALTGLMDLYNAGVVPAVPEVGSVGASGDLIPLAHVARVMTGEGYVLKDGKRAPAGEALLAAGLSAMELPGRDALAMVNGTAFMTAYGALAVARGERLIAMAERMTGWLYRLLGCRAAALDERLHAARGHERQSESAARIRAEAERFGAYEDGTRPLQEVYSLRCAAQFLGACRDNLAHGRGLIERELGGVSDNPVVCGTPGEPCVLHGGNFQGQQVAFAADAVNAALVQAAVLAERQLDVLVNPDLNGGAPLLLAWQPGATSGMAGAQITATALVAEMRMHGGPAATSSIPTNGRNQDVVSMGTTAARLAYGQVERLAAVLAITAMAGQQLNFLRERGRAAGPVVEPVEGLPRFDGLTRDRALNLDIELFAAAVLA
jgi:tyrosine ammonia-lyase